MREEREEEKRAAEEDKKKRYNREGLIYRLFVKYENFEKTN